MTASAIFFPDVDEALAELVEEGTVERNEVEVDGQTKTYFRPAQ